ncbi:MAG: ABC-F family ATP-binding cassette domain-containing protein [Lachnospiraceae bacterium]|nr:ABC-F family ATP-binding cassette domain-containing protein [Lachnospiraceae bacterium]
MNLLTASKITKAFTDKVLLEQVDFSVDEKEKIGIIGINGTGKSSLLRILAGEEEVEEGEIITGNHVVINYLPQNPEFPEGITIYDYVTQSNSSEESHWEIEGESKRILNILGFDTYDTPVSILSGGQKKKVALAAALLKPCDILILDEPTNHLNNAMVLWLESYLKTRRGALIMVTHDRYFLDRVCNKIVEIDMGKLYSYQTNFEGFLQLKSQREEMELATYKKNQNILRNELEWIMRGAKARSTKQKARIERFEELKDMKAPEQKESVELNSLSSRLGKKTVELKGISKGYDGRKLIKDFSYIFLRSDRIGIVGDNGCGKSTLMKILVGEVEPDSGTVEIGPTVKIGYFSQENEKRDLNMRVIDYIKETAEFVRTEDGLVSASKMLERFLFNSTLQYSKIEKLSGGEKRRLYLLKVLMEAPNVLILDEPTNDLDIQTLAILEDYLDKFDGIVITVSHDRYFLDKVVDRIFAFEQGVLTQYEGGYSDYLEKAGNPYVEVAVKKSSEAAIAYKERPREKKLKFTYAEEKEYETIEEDIEKLEEKVEELDREILKAATDFVKLNELSKEKEVAEQTLEEKMERYVYLSELAEKIELEKQKK